MTSRHCELQSVLGNCLGSEPSHARGIRRPGAQLPGVGSLAYGEDSDPDPATQPRRLAHCASSTAVADATLRLSTAPLPGIETC